MDTQLVEKIVHEVKSQGVFDEFRKDSIADVDTKPAYQNLRQRVENTVKKFLAEQKWSPETNKNQLREKLRRHITESGFLDVGVERIVDQVVNPKIGSVFQPRIEEIAYKYLGLPPPPKKFEPPPPPLMHPLPPLPLNAPPLKVETCSLLPTDLEQVSPDSDKGTVKSESKDDRTTVDMETDEKLPEDEDESPPFEPLVKQENEDSKEEKLFVKREKVEPTDIKQDSDFSIEYKRHQVEENNDGLIKTEIVTNDNTNSQELSNFAVDATAVEKDVSQSADARIFQDSQLSSVSSDSHLFANGKDDSMQSSSQEAVSANISEEAQMPKFNENSCEHYNSNEKSNIKSELHFDIKKDEIKFEGTERKTGLEATSSITIKTDEEKYTAVVKNPVAESKNDDTFKFSSTNLNIEAKYEDENTPNGQELSFGSSIDDSSSIPTSHTPKLSSLQKTQEEYIQIQTPKLSTQVTPTTTPIPTPLITTPTATPSPVTSQKTDKEHQSRHSSSSSSRHKKHSKERRRSYEREKDKDSSRDRHRSSKDARESSKYRSSSSGTKTSKYYSSSSSIKYSSHHKSTTEKDQEKSSSSSTHSALKHMKHSSSHSSSSSYENQDNKKSKRDADKRHSSLSSGTHREHSSSSTSKRSERKDDHSEAKYKVQRRKSTDSNDDDDGDKSFGGGGGSKSSTQYKSTSNSKCSKPKSSNNDTNKSPPTKTNGSQRVDFNHQEEHIGEANQKTNYAMNVVILNDILENPQTQFIQLNNTGHLVELPNKKCFSALSENKSLEITEFNNNIEPLTSKLEEKCVLNNTTDLLYFEEIQLDLKERLELLNKTMDLCRNAVNSLRFDSLSDEGIELSNEEDANNEYKSNLLMNTLKRKADFCYEDNEKTPRKRTASNESEGCQMKTSPASSDSSFNSKENEEIPKNTDLANKSLVDRHKAVQKLTQQQRYSSEDLYKPRPILGQRSRRRGMDSVI